MGCRRGGRQTRTIKMPLAHAVGVVRLVQISKIATCQNPTNEPSNPHIGDSPDAHETGDEFRDKTGWGGPAKQPRFPLGHQANWRLADGCRCEMNQSAVPINLLLVQGKGRSTGDLGWSQLHSSLLGALAQVLLETCHHLR